VEGRKKKKFNKNGNSPAGPSVDPRLVGDCWSLASPGLPTCGRRLLVAGLPATSSRDQVARPRPGPDRWSPAVRRLAVAARRSAAQGQPATSGRSPAAGRRVYLLGYPNFFEIFLFKKNLIFGSLGNGPGHLEEWVYSAPIF
jgi:hypothetical protein